VLTRQPRQAVSAINQSIFNMMSMVTILLLFSFNCRPCLGVPSVSIRRKVFEALLSNCQDFVPWVNTVSTVEIYQFKLKLTIDIEVHRLSTS